MADISAKRILLLFEYPTLHGGEQSLLATLPVVQEARCCAMALAPPDGPLAAALLALGVEVHPFTGLDGAGEKLRQEARRRQLAAAIEQLQPDLVHANSLAMSRLAGPVTSEAGIPSVGHLRDIVSLSRRAIEDINRHTRLLAVSEATRDWHFAQGLDPAKTFVCYNGVDLDRFQPRAPTGFLHAELGLPRSSQLVGSVGQVGMRKGLDVAIESMASLAPWCPELHWIVVGERASQKEEAVDFERRLREAAGRAPLAGRVHFLGMRQDVNRILNELTLLIHAARQEPLGRVLLEAAASGLPMVAADVGGTAEILPRKDFPELLVAPQDPKAMAERMAQLLANPFRRIELAALLRKHALADFAAHPAGQRLLGHYEAVLAPKLS